jgi:hypothetical protein
VGAVQGVVELVEEGFVFSWPFCSAKRKGFTRSTRISMASGWVRMRLMVSSRYMGEEIDQARKAFDGTGTDGSVFGLRFEILPGWSASAVSHRVAG